MGRAGFAVDGKLENKCSEGGKLIGSRMDIVNSFAVSRGLILECCAPSFCFGVRKLFGCIVLGKRNRSASGVRAQS